MSQPPVCPRCAGALRPPDLWSSEWRCGVHGDVAPFYVAARVCVEALQHVLAQAIVPVWLPQPMLPGWTVSGLGHAGDERSGGRATVVAISGPSPLGGPARKQPRPTPGSSAISSRSAGPPSGDGPEIATTVARPPDRSSPACPRPETVHPGSIGCGSHTGTMAWARTCWSASTHTRAAT